MNVQAQPEENHRAVGSTAPQQQQLDEERTSLTQGDDRARELLNTMKERREYFSGLLKRNISRTSSHDAGDTRIIEGAGTTTKSIHKPPLSVESDGIKQKDSMDRRKAFHRNLVKSPTNSHYSFDGSEATKHSAATRSTVATEESNSSMSSPGSIDGMINRSIHVMTLPKTPLLGEIREVTDFTAPVPETTGAPPETSCSNHELDQTFGSSRTSELLAEGEASSSSCSSTPSFHCDVHDNAEETKDANTESSAVPSEKLETASGGDPIKMSKAESEELEPPSAASPTQPESPSSDLESDLSLIETTPQQASNIGESKDGYDDSEPEMEQFVLPVRSFDNTDAGGKDQYAASPFAPLSAEEPSSENLFSMAASVPLPDSVPVTPTTPRNFDETSRPSQDRPPKLLTFDDVHIPQELTPLGNQSVASHNKDAQSAETLPHQTETRRPAVRSRRGNPIAVVPAESLSKGYDDVCSETSSTPNSPATSLETKEERSAYIGQLYRPDEASGRNKLQTPSLKPSTGLRRHERENINRSMVRDRVGILKGTSRAKKKHRYVGKAKQWGERNGQFLSNTESLKRKFSIYPLSMITRSDASCCVVCKKTSNKNSSKLSRVRRAKQRAHRLHDRRRRHLQLRHPISLLSATTALAI